MRSGGGSQPVGDGPRDGCRHRLHALREERADDSGEYVPRTGGRERRWPEIAYDRCSVGRCDDRVRALQQDDRLEASGHFACGLETMRADPLGVAAQKPPELAGVRGEDRGRRALDRLEVEECVGVDDRRKIHLLEQRTNERAPLRGSPEARADGERIRALGSGSDGLDSVVVRPRELDRLERDHLGCGE